MRKGSDNGETVIERIQKWMYWFSPLVAMYAIFMIAFPFMSFAQFTPYRDVDRRIESIEKTDIQVATVLQNLDKRITVLETIQKTLDENNIWQKGTSVGMGMLLLETVVRLASRRSKGGSQ
jgi:hypothetical protein